MVLQTEQGLDTFSGCDLQECHMKTIYWNNCATVSCIRSLDMKHSDFSPNVGQGQVRGRGPEMHMSNDS